MDLEDGLELLKHDLLIKVDVSLFVAFLKLFKNLEELKQLFLKSMLRNNLHNSQGKQNHFVQLISTFI